MQTVSIFDEKTVRRFGKPDLTHKIAKILCQISSDHFLVFLFRLDTFCFSSDENSDILDIFDIFGIFESYARGCVVMIYTRAFADLSAPRSVGAKDETAYRVSLYNL